MASDSSSVVEYVIAVGERVDVQHAIRDVALLYGDPEWVRTQ